LRLLRHPLSFVIHLNSSFKAMNHPSELPNEQDAVLGGDSPAPAQAAVLGGIGQVEKRLASDSLETKFIALRECLNYGKAGIDHILRALNDPSPRIQYEAYRILRGRSEPQIKEALHHYRWWQHFERLNGKPCYHAQSFANRAVESFDPKVGVQEPVETAFALRLPNWGDEGLQSKVSELASDPKANQIEAIVFGTWDRRNSSVVTTCLLETQSSFSNLKALFIGDILDQEDMISSIVQSDLSGVLEAYPNLEILHVRGDGRRSWDRNPSGLSFSQLQHENLMALRIESGGLSQQAISDLCSLELPSLEYLELWLGRDEYGGNSSIEDLSPIISGEAFPKLKYLGLRNCEYGDDIAFALADSPLMDSLIELDLSMGTLTVVGMSKLINSSKLNTLDTLNISQCQVAIPFVENFSDIQCNVISEAQRISQDRDPYEPAIDLCSLVDRYCVVAE
jgi:hypothetical protein